MSSDLEAARDAPSDCLDEKDNVLLLELEQPTSCTTATLPNTILQTVQEYHQPNHDKTHHWRALLFGQSIAIAAASVNASSFTLEQNLGVVLPIFQMSILYMILSSYLCCRRHDDEEEEKGSDEHDVSSSFSPTVFYTCPIFKLQLKLPWWMYFLMSLLDVEANYMVLLSLKFTSLTSTTLLGSLTVPSVMICSKWILARVFSPRHYTGVCLCLLGGTIMVWSDNTQQDDYEDHPYSYIGDLLAIAAALLYGLGDTVAEYAIKNIDRTEYLGMLGLFGFLISFVQCMALEYSSLLNLLFHTTPTTQHKAFATMVWYIMSLVFYYVASSYFLTLSDATLLNLSLQTTSLWASVFDVVANGTIPPLVFFLAVLLVTLGVCVYQVGGEGGTRPILEKEEESSSDESETLTRTPSGGDQEGGYMSIKM
jgi:solute carrier family 35 protein F1/2